MINKQKKNGKPVRGTKPFFTYRDWGNPQKSSSQTTEDLAETWNRQLSNTSLQNHPYEPTQQKLYHLSTAPKNIVEKPLRSSHL